MITLLIEIDFMKPLWVSRGIAELIRMKTLHGDNIILWNVERKPGLSLLNCLHIRLPRLLHCWVNFRNFSQLLFPFWTFLWLFYLTSVFFSLLLCMQNGWSPLLLASEEGHVETVKQLLQYNARVDVFDEVRRHLRVDGRGRQLSVHISLQGNRDCTVVVKRTHLYS